MHSKPCTILEIVFISQLFQKQICGHRISVSSLNVKLFEIGDRPQQNLCCYRHIRLGCRSEWIIIYSIFIASITLKSFVSKLFSYPLQTHLSFHLFHCLSTIYQFNITVFFILSFLSLCPQPLQFRFPKALSFTIFLIHFPYDLGKPLLQYYLLCEFCRFGELYPLLPFSLHINTLVFFVLLQICLL